jgi:anti-anti-sigma factor
MTGSEGELFSLSASELGSCSVVTVRGELDEMAAPLLDEAIDAQGDGPVIVDLSEVDFICSAGIHALLRRRPAVVAIVSPPGNVARVLGIVRAERTTRLFDDLASACEALSRTLVGAA